MCESCDLCFDLHFGQVWHETLNGLTDLLSGHRPDECFDHFRSLLGGSLLDLFLDESLDRSKLFPNHIGQCGTNGIGLFADKSIDALVDQRACDFDNAVPNDGFEEGHFP